MADIKSKPYKGWAVFNRGGYLLGWTVSSRRRDSITAILAKLEQSDWDRIRTAHDLTVRRVVVMEASNER